MSPYAIQKVDFHFFVIIDLSDSLARHRPLCFTAAKSGNRAACSGESWEFWRLAGILGGGAKALSCRAEVPEYTEEWAEEWLP